MTEQGNDDRARGSRQIRGIMAEKGKGKEGMMTVTVWTMLNEEEIGHL